MANVSTTYVHGIFALIFINFFSVGKLRQLGPGGTKKRENFEPAFFGLGSSIALVPSKL